MRRSLGSVKAGHAGTLDPAASGLLLIALGSATRLLRFLPLEPKRYVFSMQFGTATDTLDGAGRVTESGAPLPTRAALEAVLPTFGGEIMQTPPAYSSVKIGGERAYSLARQGNAPDLPPRTVTIHELRLFCYDEAAGCANLETVCSGGTYVRSLGRDIALALNTCGHVSAIRRTAVGRFRVEDALSIDDLACARERVIPFREALSGMPVLEVSTEQKKRLQTGRMIETEEGPHGTSPVFAFDDDRLVAVLERTGGNLHPVVVLA